jgi:hypothetical protein
MITDFHSNGAAAAHPIPRGVDGVELPAPGTWAVHARHASVMFSLPRGLRRSETCQGRVTAASIVVGEHSDDLTLLMRVDAPGVPVVGGSSGGSIARPFAPQPDTASVYSWPLFGQLSINGSMVPVQAILDYHGVWRRGGWTYGWFVLDGVIDDGARARRRMRFSFELLADVPKDVAVARSAA